MIKWIKKTFPIHPARKTLIPDYLFTINIHFYIYIYIYFYFLVGRVFANNPEDLGSIPRRVMPKTLKMVLDTSLLNIQQYKVGIKGKVEQSREKTSDLPYSSV